MLHLMRVLTVVIPASIGILAIVISQKRRKNPEGNRKVLLGIITGLTILSIALLIVSIFHHVY